MKKIFLLVPIMLFSSVSEAATSVFADYLAFSKVKQTITLSGDVSGDILTAIEGGDNFYLLASELGPNFSAAYSEEAKKIVAGDKKDGVTLSPKNQKLTYSVKTSKTGFEFSCDSLSRDYSVLPEKGVISMNGTVSYGPPMDASTYNFKAEYNSDAYVHSFPLTKKGKNYVFRRGGQGEVSGKFYFSNFSIKISSKGKVTVKISGNDVLKLFCQAFVQD